jgi:hypothetical protein
MTENLLRFIILFLTFEEQEISAMPVPPRRHSRRYRSTLLRLK